MVSTPSRGSVSRYCWAMPHKNEVTLRIIDMLVLRQKKSSHNAGVPCLPTSPNQLFEAVSPYEEIVPISQMDYLCYSSRQMRGQDLAKLKAKHLLRRDDALLGPVAFASATAAFKPQPPVRGLFKRKTKISKQRQHSHRRVLHQQKRESTLPCVVLAAPFSSCISDTIPVFIETQDSDDVNSEVSIDEEMFRPPPLLPTPSVVSRPSSLHQNNPIPTTIQVSSKEQDDDDEDWPSDEETLPRVPKKSCAPSILRGPLCAETATEFLSPSFDCSGFKFWSNGGTTELKESSKGVCQPPLQSFTQPLQEDCRDGEEVLHPTDLGRSFSRDNEDERDGAEEDKMEWASYEEFASILPGKGSSIARFEV